MAKVRFVGLDVHSASIAVAVAEPGRGGEVRSLGHIPNTPDAVRRLVKQLGTPDRLRVCYEAGPCGYVLYWQLTRMGVACEVIAPTLIPMRAGDRVKTDRRDAEKLARCYRAGDLTPVFVPDEAHEALRDLVRAREAAQEDRRRAQQRLLKLLLRHGRRPSETGKNWTKVHLQWLDTQRFGHEGLTVAFADYLNEVRHASERVVQYDRAIDHAVESAPPVTKAVVAALQALRGVAKTTAVTVAVEVGCFSRFERARELMAYSGGVPSERSSGGPGNARRGSITKTGNAHVRRIITEAAWHYRHAPCVSKPLRARQKGQSAKVRDIAWKAQTRLTSRFRRLMSRGKPPQKVATAVARELLGFMWAIGREVEKQHLESTKSAA